MTLHFSPLDTEIQSPDVTQQAKAPLRKAKGFYRRVAKPAIDKTLTILAAPAALPLILVMAALIALDGRNPFYSQLRVGQGGRLFRIWKMRTMVHNADEILEEYLASNPAARLEWDSTQKLKRDPRITLVGRVLRKTSLDELPQLWNVFNGTMSLVGPRPIMKCQRETYTGTGYYRLKPGITGLWQVSDRNESEFIARAHYDNLYDGTVSLKTDIVVLIRTVGVVLRGTGY